MTVATDHGLMPSTRRLLLGLRRALNDASKHSSSAEARYALSFAQIKRTVVFSILDRDSHPQSLVPRGEQPDRFIELDLGEIPDEYEVVRFVFDAGLPVAEPLWLETDASRLGFRFMVSRKIPGSNVGTAVGASNAMRAEVGRSL